jgi:hypothetical protein
MARMTVRDAELRTMLRIVNAPDDAADGEPLPRSVIVALSQLFGADAVFFMGLDVEQRETPLYQQYDQLSDVDDADVPSDVFWSNYWTEPGRGRPDERPDRAATGHLRGHGPHHMENIFQRLRVTSRAAAVVQAFARGSADPVSA